MAINPQELAKGPISAKRPPGWQPGQVEPTGYKRDVGTLQDVQRFLAERGG